MLSTRARSRPAGGLQPLKSQEMTETQRSAVLLYGLPALLLVVGLIVGWVGHGAAYPTGRTATAANYDDWTLTCPPYTDTKSYCTLAEPIIEPRSKMTVASLTLGRVDGALKMLVTFPLNLNILLEPGLGIVVGSDPMRAYHYDTCTPQGCVAIIPVDDKLLQSLRSSKMIQLVFAIPTKDRKPVSLKFSIASFDKADDAYESSESVRHSWFRRIWS
jgi:invasion protein IalB